MHTPPKRQWDAPFGLLLAAYLVLAGAYSVVNPLFEAPDEVWHFEYVRWLAAGHSLPKPADLGTAPWRQEGSQPPLYYALAALLALPIAPDNAATIIRYNPHAAVGQAEVGDNKNMMVHTQAEDWPWQGVVLSAHLIRLFSVGLGALTVFCTYQMATLIFVRQQILALGAAALVALNPQFLFLSAAINNDNLVTACCATALWLLVASLASSQRWTPYRLGLLGLLVGLAALSKVSGLALLPLSALTLLLHHWPRRAWVSCVMMFVAVGGVAALVAGWWYWRNWQFYGDPFGLAAMFAVLPGRDQPLSLHETLRLMPGIGRSFWAVFGWFNIVVDGWVYQLYLFLTALGLLGLLGGLVGLWWRKNYAVALWAPLALLISWVLLIGGLVVRWAQISYPQGRLLFPAISALAVLWAYGLAQWWPTRWQTWLTGGLLVILAIPAVSAPWAWIRPAYTPPPLLAANTQLPNLSSVDFGQQIRLRGYDLNSATVHPGGTLDLTLYWQALTQLSDDYSIFVHATDEVGLLQAQHDSYPAGGLRPTRDWPLNQVVVDPHRLQLPAVLPGVKTLTLAAGVYRYADGQRLPTRQGEQWLLGQVTLGPGPTQLQPSRVNFGDEIALINYDFDRRLIQPGQTLTVTLTWEALAVPRTDYTVFVHLLLPPDQVWAQRDAMPQAGAAPTSRWRVGQRLVDIYQLKVAPGAPPGVYWIEIGLYDPATGDRLTVNLDDAGVKLGQVRVVNPP